MATNIEQIGIAELTRRLLSQNRVVEKSPIKTFDLRVDGVLSEVKVKCDSLAKFDFIGLTDAQQSALARGEDFKLFVVANTRSHECDKFEIVEIDASELRQLAPKVEATHYYYGTKLRKLVNACVPPP